MGEKRGQQELVGFVLIVILVIVALMVFLVISLKKPVVSVKSDSTESMLSSIMSYTTDCIVSEPFKKTVGELIESCYKRERCSNINKMTCDYLNESLIFIANNLTSSDATISSFRIHIYWQNEQETESDDILLIGKSCVGGTLRGDAEPIYTDSGNINIRLELCKQ